MPTEAVIENLESRDYDKWEREKAELRNKSEAGKANGYDCTDCKNRGYFHVYIPSEYGAGLGYHKVRECKCVGARKSLRRIAQSGLADLIDECTFDAFIVKSEWQKEMKKKAEVFLADTSNRWFCVLGAVGSGKTHICTAICRELLNRGEEVRYMMWLEEVIKIKAVAMDADERRTLIEPLKVAPVLYIDDLFKTVRDGVVSDADIKLAFEILNYRYINKKLVTIISSERCLESILNLDEAVGSRIYRRSKDCIIELSGADKNYRYKS